MLVNIDQRRGQGVGPYPAAAVHTNVDEDQVKSGTVRFDALCGGRRD